MRISNSRNNYTITSVPSLWQKQDGTFCVMYRHMSVAHQEVAWFIKKYARIKAPIGMIVPTDAQGLRVRDLPALTCIYDQTKTMLGERAPHEVQVIIPIPVKLWDTLLPVFDAMPAKAFQYALPYTEGGSRIVALTAIHRGGCVKQRSRYLGVEK